MDIQALKKFFKGSSIFNCLDLQMYVKQFSAYGEKTFRKLNNTVAYYEIIKIKIKSSTKSTNH